MISWLRRGNVGEEDVVEVDGKDEDMGGYL